MKKLIALGCLIVGISANAAVFSTNLVAGAVFLVPTIVSGAPSTVNYIFLTATTATNTSIDMYNQAWIGLGKTNSQYSTITRYATNYVATWTNYYGATNTWTNTVLVAVSNNVPAATSTATPVCSLVAPASTQVEYNPINIPFPLGIQITNSSLGTASITIGYTQ